MQLDSIQMPTQALSAGIKRTLKTLTTKPPREWGKLAGHREMLSPSRIHCSQKLTQQHLATPIEPTCAIGIGSIHKRKTALNSGGESGLKMGIVSLWLIPPQQLIPPCPGSKSNSCHAATSLFTP
jgi:hypothetical protein